MAPAIRQRTEQSIKSRPDAQRRIIDVLRERIPGDATCPVCGHAGWTLADGVLNLSAQPFSDDSKLIAVVVPCVALVCDHCGRTELFNLLALGLEDLVPTPSRSLARHR